MRFVKARFGAKGLGAVLGSILLSFSARAASVSVEAISTPLVSRPNSGGDSVVAQLSGDARWALFMSSGNGLVTNDNNGLNIDLFLRDLQTGATTLLSRGLNGAGGSGDSYVGSLSADARFVVFESTSDNLVADDLNEGADVFLYDRNTGLTTLLSQTAEYGADGEAGFAGMSDDARFVLFESTSDDLVDIDSNEAADLFLLDRSSGEITLISANSDGDDSAGLPANANPAIGLFEAAISEDGQRIVFISLATNLVSPLPANLAGANQLYLWDRASGTNRLVSAAASNTEKTTSRSPVLSANGQYLAFLSEGHAASPNISPRLYLLDIASGVLVAVPAPAGVTAATSFEEPAISADGQSLVYVFGAQIFHHDVPTGANRLISPPLPSASALGLSSSPLISADGRVITFLSFGTNVTTATEGLQLFSFDRSSGALQMLSRNTLGNGGGNGDVFFPVLSADGRKAAFTSIASDLAALDSPGANDAFIVSTSGADPVALLSPGDPTLLSGTGDRSSQVSMNALSLDGRYLVFRSDATDLVPDDTNEVADLFLRDLQSRETRRISLNLDGTQRSAPVELIGISANGGVVIYSAPEPVGGTNISSLLAYDIASRTTRLVNIAPNGEVIAGRSASITANGRFVAFISVANEIFVRDLVTETTSLVMQGSSRDSVVISPGGAYLIVHLSNRQLIERVSGNRYPLPFQLTITENPFSADDGAFLATTGASAAQSLFLFPTASVGSSNLIAANVLAPVAFSPDGSLIIYHRAVPNTNRREAVLYDVASSNVSTIAFGANNVRLQGAPAFSLDGRFMALAITNEIDGAASSPTFTDLYVYDRFLTNMTLVSRTPLGGQGNGPSSSASISANGQIVAFDSAASDLVANDRNGFSDVFVARLTPMDANNNGIEDGWELLNLGGPSDAGLDPDHDRASNLQEYTAGTDPRDPGSVLALQPLFRIVENRLSLQWSAIPGKSYQIQFREAFGAGLWINVAAPQVAAGTGSLTLEIPAAGATGFYRLQAL